jgi:hypothetical protein
LVGLEEMVFTVFESVLSAGDYDFVRQVWRKLGKEPLHQICFISSDAFIVAVDEKMNCLDI